MKKKLLRLLFAILIVLVPLTLFVALIWGLCLLWPPAVGVLMVLILLVAVISGVYRSLGEAEE